MVIPATPTVGLLANHYWLGATDAAKEGTWIWEHNKQPVPMGNPFWHIGEPSTSTTYNCAYLHASYSHRWFDIACTSSAKAICLRNG